MPIATPEIYAEMLDRAKREGFAYPAINVTSSQTLNAALRGFAEAESDGIIQSVYRRRGVPLRRDGEGHGRGRHRRWPSTRAWSRRSTRSASPCTPTTARRTGSTAT